MTSTLKITIADDKYPLVERYQGDIKLGEKKVTKDALFEQFIYLTPVDKLLYILMDSKLDELEFYLNTLSEVEPKGFEFVSVLLNYLPYNIENRSKIKETIELIFDLADNNLLSADQFNTLVLKWGENIQTSPILTEEHVDIMKSIFQKSLLNDENVEIKKRMAEFYKELLYSIRDTDVKDWVLQHLDLIPLHEIKEHVQKREETSKETIIYNLGRVPKNAAFVASTSKGLTYFYDIAMSQYSVKYADARFNDVGHPRLLFAISVNESGKAYSIKLGALKSEDTLDGNTVIYKYPYSNVTNSGIVCWHGYNDLDIDTIPMMFLSAPNNNHLGANTLELFKRFENQPFDESLLGEGKWQLSNWL